MYRLQTATGVTSRARTWCTGKDVADAAPVLALLYVVGVVVGLLATDGGAPARIGLAVLWPLGPLAFVVTLSILLAASLVAFPLLGVAVLAAVAIAYSLWFV